MSGGCGLVMTQGLWVLVRSSPSHLAVFIMIFGHSRTSKVMRGAQSWQVLIKHGINTSAVVDLWKEFKCLKSRGVGINEL